MNKPVIGPNYIQLKPGDKIEKGDEFWSAVNGNWQQSRNTDYVSGSLVYRRKAKPYFADYRQPQAPVRPVQTLWAETPPYVPPKPVVDPGEGYYLLEHGEEIKEGDECLDGVLWVSSVMGGCTVGSIGSLKHYRRKKTIPALPPAPEGWYYLSDNETIKDGDRYLSKSGEENYVYSSIGRNVACLKSRGNGFWAPDWVGVIRRAESKQAALGSCSPSAAVKVNVTWDGIDMAANAMQYVAVPADKTIKAGTMLYHDHKTGCFTSTCPSIKVKTPYDAYVEEQGKRIAAEDLAASKQRTINSLETQVRFLREDYFKTCEKLGDERKKASNLQTKYSDACLELGKQGKLFASAKDDLDQSQFTIKARNIEIGKLKDKLFEVEKHCRGVEEINAGLNKKLKAAETSLSLSKTNRSMILDQRDEYCDKLAKLQKDYDHLNHSFWKVISEREALRDESLKHEKQCKSALEINAGLQKEIADLKAQPFVVWPNFAKPIETAPKDDNPGSDFNYIQLYMGGEWLDGFWGPHSQMWLSSGNKHNKTWDAANQPTMWKPLDA